MRVRNIKGTSRYKDPYGYESWLDYWCKHRHKVFVCTSCDKVCCHDLVGAHVQKANSTDKRYYITPLCRSCNNRIGVFTVTTPLVPVPSNL